MSAPGENAPKPPWRPERHRPEDLPGLVALAQQNLGGADFGRPEFVEWQYARNPAGPPVIEIARAPDGTIVGQYVVIPMRMAVHGREVTATLSLNTLVDERYRGQGMFTKLAERVYADCAERGLPFTYGFPNQNSYPGFVRQLRFADIGSIPMLLHPLDWAAVARRFGRLRALAPLAGAVGRLHGVAGRWVRHARARGCRVEEIAAFDTRFDAFWERNRCRYDVLVARRRDYLTWRFVDVPLRRYRLLAAEGAGGILGYAALRRAEYFGFDVGFVVDLFVDGGPEGGAAGRALVARAFDLFERDGVALVAAHALPATREFRTMRACGLVPCPPRFLPRPTPVIFRAHAPEAAGDPALPDLGHWHLTLGDYDAV